MSITTVPEAIRLRLWGRAAGRCEYMGCNQPLWLDSLTKSEFNIAYVAHIVADSPNGPRGHNILSDLLKADISNLMLLCDSHHRLVDKSGLSQHPVERLKAMKQAHEQRMDITTAISPQKNSHVLLYGANIGHQNAKVSYEAAAEAMVPDFYPAELNGMPLGLLNSSFTDRTKEFWTVEAQNLRNLFNEVVRPRFRAGNISHLSVFAFAPQPLLILLGSLLSDIPAGEVYQLHREPPGWKWEFTPEQFEYEIGVPDSNTAPPALVFSLSATVTDDRVYEAMGGKASIWRVSVPIPHNDFLKSRAQARVFRQMMRQLMDRIKSRHGENAKISVFPAMPVALAVDFGRILMPKADLPLSIYDQDISAGKFVHALDVGEKAERSV